MKLKEIYDIEDVWNEIDGKFNPENAEFRNEEEIRYTEIATKSKGHTPVIKNEPKEEEKWTNAPQDDAGQSPGYRAGESVKKRSGVPHKQYNKFADQPYNVTSF